MNVSDLLQDSPSQHRKRPSASQHESPPPTQSATASLNANSASPQSHHQIQHPHPHPHPPQPPLVPQAPYPPQPNPAPYYAPSPFSRPDPPPMHRITPRPPSQVQTSPIDPTPAMASLQHPSAPAPPPHVHPPTSWGPPLAPRQGSSPLAVSNLGPGPASHHARTHHQQQSAQIKPVMSGSERSPVVQRAHLSGSSTPSNMRMSSRSRQLAATHTFSLTPPTSRQSSNPLAAHSPSSSKLLMTPSGTLILDKRTAEEQKARLAAQAQAQAHAQTHGPLSGHPNTSPGTSFKPGRDREKDWERDRDRERQEDMELIRHAARERGVAGPYERDRERERALPSPRERSIASPHERSLAPSLDRPIPPAHERSLVPSLDRPIPSPHDRDRHMRRMSPLARAPPTQGPPPRVPAQGQQSPPGPSHRLIMPPPPHDRVPPMNERDRMPPIPHDRPPHDRDRIHPPLPLSHPHRPPGPPLLPGQGQFQTHPPDWDPRDRGDIVVPREREMPMGVGGPSRDLVREKEMVRDRDPTRDPEYGYHPDHDRAAYARERDRQRMRDPPRDPGVHLPPREREMMMPGQREMGAPREREREIISARERERMDRDREMMAREMEGMPMGARERELRERELHIQRERERVAGMHREGETGPGVPPRGHDRERERERRTHSRLPSPHSMGMNMPNSGPGMPPLPASSTTGPGAPGPHHSAPLPHEFPREREMQLMNERERQLAWEREREMERRQYRERIAIPERDRMGVPGPERDTERMAMTDRERAMAERDRAMFERDRGLSDRDRAFLERERLERERMVERDRAFQDQRERMLFNERDRVMHERERAMPPDQRERAILERERERHPADRERLGLMEPHRLEMLDRERAEAFERERIDAMERERGIGMEVAGSSGVLPRDRERERERDNRMAVDVPLADREREERPMGPGVDREMAEKRERERLDLIERERPGVMEREREQMNPAHREGEVHTEAERERQEALGREQERERERGRFEMLQRERNELLERDRLGGLDIMERERLEMVERESFEILERERLEMLERERLEMLERMPSAEELAKTRKEREKKPFVSLGTHVWPRTPFPYYFPEWIPTPIVEEEKAGESKATEAGSSSSSLPLPAPSVPQPTPAVPQIPTELRLTVLIPPSFLPPARPSKFRLWGGGLPPPPPFPVTPSIYSFSRRRVYTDDSDVIQCAVHAGLLTWSGIARTKKEGKTIRVVLALVPTLASASGAVKSGQSDSRVGMCGGVNGSINGHVNGTASVPRTRTSTPLPPVPPASSVPSTSSFGGIGDLQPPGYAGGVWASRFIGGWGESFYGKESAGRGESAGRMTSFEEAEDDGRGCVSCGWGWGHDGSAFEVISVDVVEQNAHIAPGLGIRNRAQRLAEYAQRRADILGLAPPPPSPPLFDVTNTPKRRRLDVDFGEMKRAGASEVALITEEGKRMRAMTISFGIPDKGKGKTGIGFKYDPEVVKCALFPQSHQASIVNPPPRKRRKITSPLEGKGDGDGDGDVEEDSRSGVVLESTKETYLVTRAVEGGTSRYTLSVFGPPERIVDGPPATPSSSLDPLAAKPSIAESKPEPAASAPSIPLVDIASNTNDSPTSVEPPEGKPTSPTEAPTPPPTSTTVSELEPSEPDASAGAKGKAKEDSTSPIPTPKPQTPSITPPPPIAKHTLRVLRENLREESFMFEDVVITVKEGTGDKSDDKMSVDDDVRGDVREGELKMRVLRWRWHLRA